MNKEESKQSSNPLWQLNEQMKKLREDNGLSIEEFAQLLNVVPECIKKLEHYRKFWKFQTCLGAIRKFGKTFKIEIVDRQ